VEQACRPLAVLAQMGASRSCSCVLAEKGPDAQPMVLTASQAVSSSKMPEDFESWGFDVIPLNSGGVQKAAAWILNSKRGDSGSAEVAKQTAFTQSVCEGYLSNPYHNAQHALDVLQTAWRMGELMPWGQIYSEQEQYAIMVAALAHDIGHFGLTNMFLADIRDELSICFNDISPLEQMHCNKLFRILAVAKRNVFSHISAVDFKDIRAMIIDAILFTDSVKHGTIIKDLQILQADNAQLFCSQNQGDIAELLSSKQNKTVIARTVLHSADLSNPCKPWKNTFAWAQNLINEFFAQGDQEKELGLPIGLLNDRTKVSLPHSQLGLIQFMVAPLVSAYTRIFRNWRDLSHMLANNVGEWSRIYLEKTGMDESSRVQVVCGMLESATCLKIADAPAEATAIEAAPVECANDDALPEVTDQHCVVVREVRRWQQQEADKIGGAKGQHRELVLLYVLSDRDALASHNDIVMKFNANQAHFKVPENEKVARADGARVVTVAVAADNMHSQLKHAEFDVLLSALLDKQAR